MSMHVVDIHCCNLCQHVLKNKPTGFRHIKRRHGEEYNANRDDWEALMTPLSYDVLGLAGAIEMPVVKAN